MLFCATKQLRVELVLVDQCASGVVAQSQVDICLCQVLSPAYMEDAVAGKE